jgi:hypothetical protein
MIRNDMNKIAHIVGEHYGVTLAELRSSERCRRIARPRQVAMYFCRENLSALGKYNSQPEIGKFFGHKDHTTVLHGTRRIEFLLLERKISRREISYLRYRINSEFYDATPFKSAAQSAIVFNTGAIPPNPAPVNSAGRAAAIIVAPSRSFFPILPYVSSRQNGPGRLPSPPAPRPSGVSISEVRK